MTEIGDDSDNQDDFRQFDKEQVSVALFGLDRVDKFVMDLEQLLQERLEVDLQLLHITQHYQFSNIGEDIQNNR